MLIDKNGRDARKDKIVWERLRREEELERGSGKREKDREEEGERDGKEGRVDRGTERQRGERDGEGKRQRDSDKGTVTEGQ